MLVLELRGGAHLEVAAGEQGRVQTQLLLLHVRVEHREQRCHHRGVRGGRLGDAPGQLEDRLVLLGQVADGRVLVAAAVIAHAPKARGVGRSEEHTSELQSLMRISYAVFCLNKKTTVVNKYQSH